MPSVGCFDPHRPYQPNRLKKHVLAQVHFPVYLWCTLTLQPNHNAITSRGVGQLDMSGWLSQIGTSQD